MATPSAVGSAAWTGGEEYVDEYAERISRFLRTVDLEALRTRASALRGGRPCTVSPEFSVGNFNLVRKIQFDDGVEWIARMRMPPVYEEDGRVENPSPVLKTGYGRSVIVGMESELATMEFIRQNTDIPIPEVYDYNLDEKNAVGCPFSLMEYFHGNTAEEVAQSFPGDHEGIPEDFEEKFWRQLAGIMVQLASIRMPKIGSIFRDKSDPTRFIVGPFVETGSGPYESLAEFYADYPLALDKLLKARGDSAPGQGELLEAFRSLAASFTSTETAAGSRRLEGFGLANYDLNPNNILVDREFNILAVIDWDSVISVPDAALHRMPFLMGVGCPAPGVVDDRPPVVKRMVLSRRFAAVVEEVARERSGDAKTSGFLFTQTGFFSKEAVAFRSLVHVQMGQDWVNAEWPEGLKWLREHSDADAAQFYLQHLPSACD